MAERPDDLVQEKDLESERLMRNASPEEYIEAIEGVDFPAAKSAIVRKAMDRGGLDSEVQHVLRQMDDRAYESVKDLMAEVERVYGAGGGLPPTQPAAPP